MKVSMILILFILFIGFSFAINSKINQKEKQEKIVFKKQRQPEIILLRVRAAYYNPVEEQCDSIPLLTASGDKIDVVRLKKKRVRWVACSRNLMRRWGGRFDFGDTIEVVSKNKHIAGKWIVKDVMNKRFRNKIDFLCHEKIDGSLKNVRIKYGVKN